MIEGGDTMIYFDVARERELKKMMREDYRHKYYYREELYEMYQRDYDLSMHKGRYNSKLSEELFQFYHKRKFFKRLCDELLATAWHPDRWWDWCLDNDEKQEIEKLWLGK